MTDAVLRVKLLEPDAKAPTVAHPGSDLGFDLYALEDAVLEPGVMTRVRTGIAVEGPEGYGLCWATARPWRPAVSPMQAAVSMPAIAARSWSAW